jgi:hypothetical protein
MAGDWKNEDDIKAELRVLTDELRTLRQELRNMVAPPKQNPSRAFLHRQSWPSTPPATAADQPADPESRRRKKR